MRMGLRFDFVFSPREDTAAKVCRDNLGRFGVGGLGDGIMDIMVPVCCDGGFGAKCSSESDFGIEEDVARQSGFSWLCRREGCGRKGKISMIAACCRHASRDETRAGSGPEGRCVANWIVWNLLPLVGESQARIAERQCQETNRRTRPTRHSTAYRKDQKTIYTPSKDLFRAEGGR